MEKKKVVLLIVVIVLAVIGLCWYYYEKHNGRGLIASGTIEATESSVSSKVVGRVIELKVDEGSEVKAGDVMAVLDGQELAENLKAAQAKYIQAQADFTRSGQLYTEKQISQQQYDASSANRDAAEAAFSLSKIQYGNRIIKAPFDGVILVKAIELGELAIAGTPIVTMADLSSLKLKVYLPEDQVGKARLGQEVSVTVDSYPGEKFIGRVIYISNKAEFTPKSIQTKEERITQVFSIKIKLPNPDMKLKPGMPADAEFSWNSR